MPADPGQDSADEVAELPVLNTLMDGMPPVAADADALAEATRSLAQGSGPIAVDTERAQGFRYGSEAWLLQFRRSGSGTHLVDPAPFVDEDGLARFPELNEALAGTEWIIHAASQDLPCLRLAGLYPTRLFDTELAGRLLGLDRVGLGAMVERYFGRRLLKEHSAANWSTRPIPQDWLLYAALDVELLIGLRDRLAEDLQEAGKLEWAEQEFAHVLESFATPAPPRVDPWRRTSGINAVKSPLGMAVVRELWEERDRIARELDLAPGKILPDRAISELASPVRKGSAVPGRPQLRAVEGFRPRQAQRREGAWVEALARVERLPPGDLPPVRAPRSADEVPNPRSWERHEPEAWQRWNRVRPALNALAEELELPAENLISPDAVRRISYRPPADESPDALDAALVRLGVRPWQRGLVIGTLTQALSVADRNGEGRNLDSAF
ncbi:HRDC domain-containing protein [Aestuariimicrobium sp. p3-SID1156]|uniref:HRDC domain-containing protein n=1 Tax=Aestuariimicrobium sp. p3-SID1156 TaxID=2916038 RepID=UPI00223B2820|nr:HRDC domain-containing protein [Aestuariimicrobium sp. p3-SID1156]MCT1459027.1 HRDC domain-containing protein [Aestuariimicrobium sp. p3-SID1156]